MVSSDLTLSCLDDCPIPVAVVFFLAFIAAAAGNMLMCEVMEAVTVAEKTMKCSK